MTVNPHGVIKGFYIQRQACKPVYDSEKPGKSRILNALDLLTQYF